MNIEEKVEAVNRYCDSVDNCSKCKLVQMNGGAYPRTCYSDDRPGDTAIINKNYEILFGGNKMNIPSTHKELCEYIHELYVKKNADYGNSFGDGFKEYGITMSLIRLEDKFRRFKQLALNSNQQVNDESIEDTLIDLANYAIMTIVEMRKQEDK